MEFGQTLDELGDVVSQFNMATIKATILSFMTTLGLKILLGVIVLFVGWKLIAYVVKMLRKMLERSKVEESVITFLLSLSHITLKILLIVLVLGILGAPIASFVAVLGTAGLAVGLALQGSLSNFAGGVLILILKPFKVGDYIEEDGNGNAGTVESIDIFYTTLRTFDNKVVVIPNGLLSNNSITNYSKKETRRIDFIFGVGYEADLHQVKGLLLSLVQRHSLILDEPEPTVNVSELNSSSVDFVVKVWCKSEDYWTVKYDVVEQVKLCLDEACINIPYPQMDVHLNQISNKE